MVDEKTAITVYDRKGNAVQMHWVRGNTYAKLDADGNITGAVVNLKLALECHAYYKTPKLEGGENDAAVQH